MSDPVGFLRAALLDSLDGPADLQSVAFSKLLVKALAEAEENEGRFSFY